ncbi:purine and uridine phosphorylase [Hypomontagnella monticulosa]|nr:purine and uridine phosphorylase [Hypomontagnella monticulosa]
MDKPTLSHGDYTVGWLCALPIEQTAAMAMLDQDHNNLPTPSEDTNNYTLGSIGSHNVVIAGLPMGGYGTINAAVMATHMIHTFPSIRFGLLVGIGAGIPAKVRLGDVVVSVPGPQHTGVVQWDFGKAEQGDKFRQTGVLNKPPKFLLTALSSLRASRDLKSKKRKLPEYLDQLEEQLSSEAVSKYRKLDSMKDVVYKATYEHQHTPPDGHEEEDRDEDEEEEENEDSCKYCDKAQATEREPRDMREHYGLIASGNSVIKDAAHRKKLSKDLGEIGRHVLCIEMEAAGLMNDFPCVVIRGICDYADSHKNKVWQGRAAAVAAAFAKELLDYILPEEVKQEQSAKDMIGRVESKVDQIHAIQISRQDSELLEWLTPINFGPQQSDYLERRQQGTGKWFLNHKDYGDWMKGMNQTLFCKGQPGAGKTILTSIVVEDLEERFHADGTVGIAYIYCNYNRDETQKPRDLISSLLKQLLSRRPSLLVDLSEKLHAKHATKQTRPTIDEIFEVLKTTANAFSKLFIIVDALDEYQSSSREEFLKRIFRLRDEAEAHIFATSRPIPEIENAFTGCLTIDVHATDDDIRAYLDSQIERLPSFVSKTPELQNDIISMIMKAVGGM